MTEGRASGRMKDEPDSRSFFSPSSFLLPRYARRNQLMGLRTERAAPRAFRLGRTATLVLGLLLVSGLSSVEAQPPKGKGEPERERPPAVKLGLALNDPKALQGYTLIAPMGSPKAYLIDMQGRVVHSWTTEGPPALSTYLLENGNLLRTGNARGGGKQG